MFCSKCGKEIPDNTVFCNFCGANQTASSDTAKPQQPKKNNTMKIVIIAVVAVVAFAIGSFVIAPTLSGNKKEAPTPSSSNIDIESDISLPTINSEPTGTVLESLVPANSDDRNGQTYTASLGEGGTLTVSFGYYLDEPKALYDFIGSIEVEKTNASYTQLKAECEEFQKKAEELNDSENVRIKCKETDTGIEVSFAFFKLADADRLERVNLAAEFIGIDDTDGAFYFDSVVSQLTEIGFTR